MIYTERLMTGNVVPVIGYVHGDEGFCTDDALN
jgi:hypothetical protein